MGSEAERVHRALETGENALAEEERHFIRTCCQILKVDEKQKIDSIRTTAIWEESGKVQEMIRTIWIGALDSKAKVHQLDSSAPFQTTAPQTPPPGMHQPAACNI